MALFFVVIMSFLATSISYDTLIEYNVSAQSVNRLRSYYAAKSGVELSLLRILIYRKALAMLGDKIKGNESMLDPIWAFPFAWPPSKFLPEGLNAVDASIITKLETESLMNAEFITNISDEAGKIDINDLGSTSESIQKATRQQILKIFNIELENNDKFNEEYANFDFEQLVNNIQDWVDEDKTSANGGDEKSAYPDFRSQYELSNLDFMPPNQSFKTIDELHMVANMTDELFDLLKSRVTIYGVKGININTADSDVLKSLDSRITNEVAGSIIERIENKEKGGPFKNEEDFLAFLESEGNIDTSEFNKDGIPLLFGFEHSFVINSEGVFAGASRTITAITFDLEYLKERFVSILEKEEEEENQSDDDSSNNNNTNNSNTNNNTNSTANSTEVQKKIPSGRPTIVFWEEN